MEEEVANPQVECAKVTDAIEVEKLDSNLYRSLAKHLWVPARARGVFGGQVISQALVSATNTVDSAFHLHSMHCYFLLSATPAPILYHIDRVRDGRSYCTRAVRAHQNGRMVFVVICSFQKPEPWQVTLRPSPPPDVPKPEECKFAWENAREHASSPNATPRQRVYLSEYAEEREKSFLQIKPAGKRLEPNGDKLWFYWFRVDGMPEGNSSFQKCILGYISDSHFIGAAHRTLGLNGSNPPGPTRLGMSSTLDHSIWFYNNDFDCGEWILYVMHAPSVGSGRGLVFGKMFTQSGELIALMTQEGVVRADIRDPSLNKPSQAKL